MSRVLFLYWGKRGALVQFTLNLCEAVVAVPDLVPHLSISRQNEAFPEFERMALPTLAIRTFGSPPGALFECWRVPGIRRDLVRFLHDHRIDLVVSLMAHVWMPFVSPVIRKAGVRYAAIVHDADPHAGDPTAVVKPLWDLDLRYADRILTLSQSVTERLVATGQVERARIRTLFHPDLSYRPRPHDAAGDRPQGLRLLFLGRILPYKGLPLLVEAMKILRHDGTAVSLTVMGSGDLDDCAEPLRRMGARIENRWLSADEIAEGLASHDALVLSHTGASQSGVVAAAFGAGLPVIATPVGGLVEQVDHDRTGLLAESVTGPALAEAITRLASDRVLYRNIRREIAARAAHRSMAHFIRDCVDAGLR